MEENSIGYKIYNNNNKSHPKKIIIQFPKYISNKELEKLRNKHSHELNSITESNLYLQQSNMNNNASKRNSFIKYFKERNNLYKTKEDNSKINSAVIINKRLIKKLNNKKINNPRKYLENTNKFFPRNLLDFFHPYEYLFNHKIKNDSKNKELKLQLSDNNFNDNKRDTNLFNKKIKYFSRNKTHKLNITPINKTDIQKNSFKAKQKRIKTENNFFNSRIPKIKTLSRNKKFLISNDSSHTSHHNIFITENNITRNKERKKEFLKSLSNISGKSKRIKKELIHETELSERKSNIEINHKGRFNLDKMIQKLLDGDIYINKITEDRIIKNLFRNKKNNYFSDLTRQYSSYTKKPILSPSHKKFMNELKKMDVLEKNETFMNEYQYKKNYGVKMEVNRLQEKENSKIRKLFNKKITKMKNMNIINIESFYKNMNN